MITPAIEACRSERIDVSGPFPADTVFFNAMRGKFDAVIAMYHDQATIPVKTIAFDRAVNVTLGLPVIRTSVDHGTAYDIAGKGIANAENMAAAIDLAIEFSCVAKLRKSSVNLVNCPIERGCQVLAFLGDIVDRKIIHLWKK